MENFIEIGNSKLWTDSNNILYCQYRNSDPNDKLDLEKAKLFISAIVKLCNGTAMPFLIDARGAVGTFSIEAASLLANSPELVRLRISESFVTNSMGMKLSLSSYKRIYDPYTPHAFFNDLIEAKNYCLKSKS